MSDRATGLIFVETDVFTKRVTRLGLEGALRNLQRQLLENPTAGAVDPGTGGLRKVRMGDPARGKGKRGGGRVHYLWLPEKRLVYLIFLYGKDEREKLTAAQKKQLKGVVGAIKKARSR